MDKMSGALIRIAKKLGIQPNSKLTKDDIEKYVPRILKEYGVDEDDIYIPLNECLYDYKKASAAENRKINEKQYQKNLEEFEKDGNGLSVYLQNNAFWWHGNAGGYERLIIDINIDSPRFPEVSKKLDDFCKKHKPDVAYKISNLRAAKRTDPMNIYSNREFTPEMCAELVEILEPCLNDQYHDYLDGCPLLKNGQEVKGIKIGPEPFLAQGKSDWSSEISEYTKKIQEDLGDNIWNTTKEYLRESIDDAVQYCSFGQRTASLEVIALFYYLTGNEHKAPAIIQNHNGTPYVRLIDVDAKKDLSRESQGVGPQNGNQPSTLGQNTHKLQL